MGPQQMPLHVHVQRVPQVPRRVVGRDVEHLEVADVVLDLRAFIYDEAESPEDLRDLRDRLVDRVTAAAPDRTTGRCDIEGLRRQSSGQLRTTQLLAALG